VSSRFLVLVLLLPVLSLGQSRIASTGAGDPDLQKGLTLYQHKEYIKARDVFLHVTQIRSRSAEAFFYLGISEARLGNLPQAEDSLRRALTLDPNSLPAVYNLGVVLLDQKKPVEGAPYLERAYRKGPASPELAVNLVRCYLDLQKNDQAIAVAEAAGQRYHDLPAFHLEVGKFFASHGLTTHARAFLETANCLAPSSPEVVIPLAEVYLQEKDSAHALQVLESISPSSRDSAYFHFLMAQGYFLAGQKDATLAEMGRAIELDNRNPVFLLTLARYYQKYGNQQKALDALEGAARLAPDLPEIPYSMAVSYFIADDFDSALKFAQESLKIDPSFDRALFLLGIGRFAQGKLPEAEQALAQAEKLRPNNPFYPCFEGMVLLSENRSQEALPYFQRALALDPSYALAHYQLGRLYARASQYHEARAELEKAVGLQPDLAEAYYQLAHTYQRLDEEQKADQAMQTFKKYRGEEYTERQEVLKEVQNVVKSQP